MNMHVLINHRLLLVKSESEKSHFHVTVMFLIVLIQLLEMNKKHKEDLEQQLAKFHEVGCSSKGVLMSLLKDAPNACLREKEHYFISLSSLV